MRDVVAGGETELGDRVVAVTVEAGGDDQPRRLERRDARRDHVVDRAQVDVAGGAGRHRHVHREAAPVAGADLVGAAGAGVERPLVQADEQHARIVVEDGLRAVAVVRVVVEDQHPLAARGERRRHHRDVRDRCRSPSTRRSSRGDPEDARRRTLRPPSPRSSAATAVSPAPAASVAASHEPGTRIGVGVEPTAAGAADALDAVEVLGAGGPARGRLASPPPARAATSASSTSARARPDSTASRRAGRSGWCGPARCSRYAGCVLNNTVTRATLPSSVGEPSPRSDPSVVPTRLRTGASCSLSCRRRRSAALGSRRVRIPHRTTRRRRSS